MLMLKQFCVFNLFGAAFLSICNCAFGRSAHALTRTEAMNPISAFEWAPNIWSLLNFEIYIFTFREILLSFSLLLLTLAFRNVLTKIIFKWLKKMAANTKTDLDDRTLEALEKPVSLFLLLLGVYLAVVVLPLDPEVLGLIIILFRGVSMLFVFWGLLRLIDVAADIASEVTDKKGMAVSGFIPLIQKVVRIFVYIIAFIMVVDNLGYSVGGIIATLGLGGAAFAFASKDTIANLYGSLALALDRPFKVGDWIMVGNQVDGDVEEIGLRSTKVRTWPKTVISIPNQVMANEIINNWSRMPKRRVKQIVGVTYESKPEDMEGLVEDIRGLLREDEGVNQDFILVNFTDFAESSLNILVYYFTNSIAWLEHMDVRQRINCKIMRAVDARGLSIAFPTRTVYFEGDIAENLGASLPGDTGPTMPR